MFTQPEILKMKLLFCTFQILTCLSIALACSSTDPDLEKLRESKLLRLSSKNDQRNFGDLVFEDQICHSQVPSLPKPRLFPMATTIKSKNGQDKLMVCGGLIPKSAQHGQECWSYTQGVWNPETPLPVSTMIDSGIAAINSSIYIIGGLFQRHVWKFSEDQGWKRLYDFDMPTTGDLYAGQCAISWKNTLYTITKGLIS